MVVALPEPVVAAPPGPAMHGMQTPPQGRALPASPFGTPPVVNEPGVGCSLEELRMWVIQKFGHVNRDATELEVHAAGLLVFARQPGGHKAEGRTSPRGVPARHPVPVERVQVCAPQQEPGLQ